MSMHKKPLTDIERDGLKKHGLAIDKPSMLSDAFRLGVAWALAQQGEPVAWIEWDLNLDEGDPDSITPGDKPAIACDGWEWRPLVMGAAPAAQPVQGDVITKHQASTEERRELFKTIDEQVRQNWATPSTPQPDAREVIEQMVVALDKIDRMEGSESDEWDGVQRVLPEMALTARIARRKGQQWLKEHK